MEVTATLENWRVSQVSDKEFVIYGEIYGDSRNRFPDGCIVRTSGILNREVAEGCVVETRNSVYKLGKMYKE